MSVKKSVLYDVEWQVLRASLLSSNNEYGGFGTVSGVAINLQKLGKYMLHTEDRAERARRCWRILNLLNATLLGYGNRRQFSEHRNMIARRRDHYSARHRLFAAEGGVTDINWDDVAVDLSILHQTRKIEYAQLKMNLKRRVYTANRKKKLGTGGMQHRSELQRFLDLMQKVENV